MTKGQETWRKKKLKAINADKNKAEKQSGKQKGAAINAWFSRWTRARKEEKQSCEDVLSKRREHSDARWELAQVLQRWAN